MEADFITLWSHSDLLHVFLFILYVNILKTIVKFCLKRIINAFEGQLNLSVRLCCTSKIISKTKEFIINNLIFYFRGQLE